jgi:glycosyltransferase involved in cell wall biosynthesis
MAQSVMKLLSDRDLRRRMGATGRARVMEFDIAASVANLEAAYQDCLKAL